MKGIRYGLVYDLLKGSAHPGAVEYLEELYNAYLFQKEKADSLEKRLKALSDPVVDERNSEEPK